MIPLEKVQALIVKHDSLEKELSTGTIDSKTFAQKSKEYSELGNIISYAREYLKFDNEQKDLEQMLKDNNSDSEMSKLADKELDELKKKRDGHINRLKIFLLPRDKDDNKNAIVEIRAGTGGLEASLLKCTKESVQKKNGHWKL